MRNIVSVVSLFMLNFINFSSTRTIHTQKGFPVAFNCHVPFSRQQDKPRRRNTVQCKMMRNSLLVYEKVIAWSDRKLHIYTFDVYQNETVTVIVMHGNLIANQSTTILVERRLDICPTAGISHDEAPVRQRILGQTAELRIPCSVNKYVVQKTIFHQLNFTFYKDCEKINLSESVSIVYQPSYRRSKLGHLLLKNISYSTTPGTYSCIITYKGRSYALREMEPTKVSIKAIHTQAGFPVDFNCDVRFSKPDSPRGKNKVRCRMIRNSTFVYDNVIEWRRRKATIYSFDAYKNETITVIVTHGNRTAENQVAIFVEKPVDICQPSEDDESYSVEYGSNERLLCQVDMREIPKTVFKRLNFTFYKDCHELNFSSRVSIKNEPSYEIPTSLGLLELTNISYSKTPGKYRCVINYKGRSYVLPGMKTHHICVIGQLPKNEEPTIRPEKEEYEVAPGEDLTLKCYSKRRSSSGTSLIYWYRGDREISITGEESQSDTELFGSDTSEGKKCEPTSDDFAAASQHRLGELVSIHTLRNVNPSDSGKYSCKLVSTGKHVEVNITVSVKIPARSLVQPWIVAVVVVTICLSIALIVILLRYRLSRMLRYYIKKFFAKSIDVPDDKSVAFLVYCEDVFSGNPLVNPLKHLTEWMNQKDMPYTDPNIYSPTMKLNGPIPDTIKEGIKKCMTMVIIISKDLIVKNDLEIFTSYEGFSHNVESHQNVIFICTKKIKKMVFGTGGFSIDELDSIEQDAVQRSIKTFRKFMKRRENSVVSWSPEKISQFHKDIYVALPKVRSIKKVKQINDEPISTISEHSTGLFPMNSEANNGSVCSPNTKGC